MAQSSGPLSAPRAQSLAPTSSCLLESTLTSRDVHASLSISRLVAPALCLVPQHALQQPGWLSKHLYLLVILVVPRACSCMWPDRDALLGEESSRRHLPLVASARRHVTCSSSGQRSHRPAAGRAAGRRPVCARWSPPRRAVRSSSTPALSAPLSRPSHTPLPSRTPSHRSHGIQRHRCVARAIRDVASGRRHRRAVGGSRRCIRPCAAHAGVPTPTLPRTPRPLSRTLAHLRGAL
jgi:hypothetical protein